MEKRNHLQTCITLAYLDVYMATFKSWISLVKKIGPAISVFDQCMSGLKTVAPEGEMYAPKPTGFLTNS